MNDPRSTDGRVPARFGTSRRHRHVWFCLASVLLLAAACSSGDTDSAAEDARATPVPQDEATATPTAAPTPATVAVETAARPLDLVGIGDSFIGWSTVAEQYAELVSQDIGVEVNVAKIVSPSSNRLEYLRTTDSAQTALSDAEVVILQPEPGASAAPAFNSYLAGECGGDDGQDCLRAARADFEIYVDELFLEVLLMTPDDTMVVAPLVGAWGVAAFWPGLEESDPETYRLFVDHVVAMQQLSATAAADRGIPTVDVTLAFHGPDPYQPAADEYLLPDRTHLTDEGSRVVAELLVAAGTPAS